MRDALNILAEHPGWLKGHACGLILTPHLGEMSRLTGTGIPEIQKKIISVADQFANEYDVITVLKDARTVIGIPGGFLLSQSHREPRDGDGGEPGMCCPVSLVRS